MSVNEFRQLVACATTPAEVHRLHHVHFSAVEGTATELFDCLRAVEGKVERLEFPAGGEQQSLAA